jgi:hypothetical protein
MLFQQELSAAGNMMFLFFIWILFPFIVFPCLVVDLALGQSFDDSHKQLSLHSAPLAGCFHLVLK